MKSLFEYTDKLNKPYECFFLDVKKEWLPVQPHWHYFMEILYVTRGTALMYQNEQSYIVAEGDMIVSFVCAGPEAICKTIGGTVQMISAVIGFQLVRFSVERKLPLSDSVSVSADNTAKVRAVMLVFR